MCKVISKLVRLISLFAILFVIIYRVAISPFLPRSCRYLPSCSEYMIESIKTHGLIYGLFLGISRILRCHPFAKSGYDPVPPKKSSLNLQR